MARKAWIRSQEKGILAKGIFAQSSVTPEKQLPKDMAPAVRLALREPQPTKAHILQKPLSETPLFWFLTGHTN